VLQTVPRLAADFGGSLGAEQMVDTPDGSVRVADIRGGYFDSVVAQEQEGWTDEERIEVEQSLIELFNRIPAFGSLVSTPKAALPWPTYDDTDRAKIVEMATMLGLAAETLAYEGENKNRSTITGPLAEIVAKETADAEAEGALTAV
jgi:hypothetical protein